MRRRSILQGAIFCAVMLTGEVLAANTSARPPGGSTSGPDIPHPAGVPAVVLVSSRTLGSDSIATGTWTDRTITTQIKSSANYDIEILYTSTATSPTLYSVKLVEKLKFGSLPELTSDLILEGTGAQDLGITKTRRYFHWKAHTQETVDYDLSGAMEHSISSATFTLHDEWNHESPQEGVRSSTHDASLSGSEASQAIQAWASPYRQIVEFGGLGGFHDFNHVEKLTSNEFNSSFEKKTAFVPAAEGAGVWDGKNLFATDSDPFDDDKPAVAYLGTPKDQTKSFQKVQYKIVLTPNSPAVIKWMEVFTPKAANLPKSYVFQGWTPVAGATESPLYAIDPLALDPADGNASKRHPDQDGKWEVVRFTAELAVDANRDGTIKLASEDASDATSADNPYRFWLNDDDDDGDDKRAAADDIPLPEGNSNRDSENTKVDGTRDLEDLFPVYFDIKQLLTVLPTGMNGISYYLKQEDSALGVVFTSYTRAQAFEYLRGSPAGLDTGFGPALTQKAGDATVTKVTAAGVNISATSTAFFDRIKNNDGGVLLVEASKATTKPLVLEVRKGADVIAEIALPLKIDPVETMFRYVNLRSFAHGTPIASNNQGPGYGSTTPTAAPNDPFATAVNRKNMVFVHGYNVNGGGARGASATAFKRFYWSGSKAKFYAVLWRGDDGQGAGIAPAGATPDYHRNVGHAWQQGTLFRDFLGTLQGDTAIMAHSLGNGVTKVALTRTRDPNNPTRLVPASKPATVKHYFAVDSALPLEATSATDITSESKSRMRHSWWEEYDTLERLWPTHWHALFEGTGDGREGLTWQNVFANLEVGTNFYSSGEEVLANPVDDRMPFWEPLFFAGQRAWVAQEKLKGGNGAAAPFFRSWTAGWVENEAWYIPYNPPPPFGQPQGRRRFASEAQDVAAPNGVPSSALAAEPFFKRFQASESGGFYPGYQGSRLHAPVGDADADDEARKLVTVAKCLGEAIPALSYAQGSNPASAFTRSGMGGNFDLNEPYDPNTGLGFKNGWPASRGLDPEDQSWKHSDCLDVAYIFHHKFYDRMKNDGGLQ